MYISSVTIRNYKKAQAWGKRGGGGGGRLGLRCPPLCGNQYSIPTSFGEICPIHSDVSYQLRSPLMRFTLG